MIHTREFPFDEAIALIRTALGETGDIEAAAMKGGASTRKFARFRLASGRPLVAIFVPDANRSDEIENASTQPRRWPFLEVRDLLASRGIRVPAILAEACHQGLILVEDLGDLTLAAALEQDPQAKTPLYQIAVRDLAHAQLAMAQLPAGCVVVERSFDHGLLRWEIDHFREWALEARGIQLSDAERQVFDNAAHHLATTIASWPKGFVHRDYQSRNLMVRIDGSGQADITWIDFQDALLGPRVYDLVALLGDSYQTFDAAFVDERLDEYASAMRLTVDDRVQLRYEFDMVTVQRKLKDAGRFVFIDRIKNDPSFLEFVVPTIDKVLGALARLRDDAALLALESVLLERVGSANPTRSSVERTSNVARSTP